MTALAVEKVVERHGRGAGLSQRRPRRMARTPTRPPRGLEAVAVEEGSRAEPPPSRREACGLPV